MTEIMTEPTYRAIRARHCSPQSRTACGHVVLYGQRIGFARVGRRTFILCAECYAERHPRPERPTPDRYWMN